MQEAPNDDCDASSMPCHDNSIDQSRALSQTQSRAQRSKKNAISPLVSLATKKRRTKGFKAKRAYSDQPKPKEKRLLTKSKKRKKMMTKTNKSKLSHEVISVKSDIDISKPHAVLFDID
jgi:hypothetical protein